MRVKEFMELYSDSNFNFMTSKGYLFLNSDQVKSILLEGQKEAAKKELGKDVYKRQGLKIMRSPITPTSRIGMPSALCCW